MKPINIIRVETLEERKAFLRLPWKVYQEDLYWVPPLFSERLDFTDPEKNPFFNHADVAFYMALRGEEVVGTIAAFTNHRHNDFHDENIGFFGFFEVLQDPEAARALLVTAEDWAREKGHTALRGPAQFDTNGECGLLVDGFDDSPRILMTYNPPYYVDYLEDSGYKKEMDLWAYKLSVDDFLEITGERLERITSKFLQRRNITVRTLDMSQYNAEVEKVKELYNSAWSKNWGFVPMDDDEFDHLAKELKAIIDPELAFVAEREGKPVGFSLSFQDLNQPLREAYPRPSTPEWWTMAKLVWHWKVRGNIDWVRNYAMGVIDEYRSLGIDALFYYETAQAAIRKGITHGEMSWVLEDNEKMNKPIQAMGGEVYKSYRFYQKAL